MVEDSDSRDMRESRLIGGLIAVVCIAIVAALLYSIPMVADLLETHLTPGVGLKTAAISAFILSVIVMVIFAIFSGDGLLGEIQFILPSFIIFFALNWLLIAWIF